jgi:hypothetical protein
VITEFAEYIRRQTNGTATVDVDPHEARNKVTA